MSIWMAIVILSACGMMLLACATPETTPSSDPTLGARPNADQSYNPTPLPHPTKEILRPESRHIYLPIQCDYTTVKVGVKLHCWRADDNGVYTSIWSASGGYPSGSRGQNFETKFEYSGEKLIHLEICSVKRVCTTDEYKVFVEEESATSQHAGSTDPTHGAIGPTFTFNCGGIGGTYEAAVDERVTCKLDRAVEGYGPGEVATVTWSAPGGLPSGGTLRTFETYYYDPGIKQIEIKACSSEGGCTSDIAIITILGSGESKLDVLKPLFTFNCRGIAADGSSTVEESAVGERVTCGLGRAVEGYGSGEVATVTWSAPGGLPSGGTLRTFETYYYDPGIKQIEIKACSSEGGCTSDIAIITILGTK